jgi:branched-chain amino acid aminotransferase
MAKKKSRLVFINGNFVKEEDAKVSIYDSSLMFGDMVFEMTRSFGNKQFKLKEHLERLYLGAKILRIPINYNIKQLEKKCYETIEKNDQFFKKNDEHRLLIEVSRGILDIYKTDTKLYKGSNLIIADFPLRWTVQNMGKLFDTGINCVIPSQRAIPARYLDSKIKNKNRIFYLMANIEASMFTGKNVWPILLDDQGYISEGSGDNFFIIKNNTIITPEGRNLLRGISRNYITDELADQIGVNIIEKNIEPYDVYSADEAFISATPFCMLPVVSLNQIKIGNGKVGKIFNKLLDAWSNNVGINIKKQIKSWNKNTKLKVSPYVFKK